MKDFFPIETPYSSEEYKIMKDVVNVGIDSHLEAFTKSEFKKSPNWNNKFLWNIHNSELPLLYRRMEELYNKTQNEDVLDFMNDIQDVAQKPEEVEESVSLAETTDTEKYEDVVFLQGDEAEETMNILDELGEDAALAHLIQWHNPGEHMGSNELSHGPSDNTYEKDGYIMSWNTHIPYIGLQYDVEHGPGEIDEDSQMMRHRAGQRGKTVPLGQHSPHSDSAI